MLRIARLFMALSDLVLTAVFSLDQRNRGGAVGVIRIGWVFGNMLNDVWQTDKPQSA
jgi:hypothetical protein